MTPPRLLTALFAVAALAGFAAGCGDDDDNGDNGSSAATPAQTTTAPQTGTVAAPDTAPGEVLMKGIRFQPRDITVKVGDTVTWKNVDPVDHNAVATSGADFKSELFGEGGTYEYTAEKVGKIEYECTIHPGMTGTIDVVQ
ncbi:plastocyanin/azurin family copper-binding protein [Paraconexibacter sp.]|uniref:cupredoxin domain-containing protein n=1 Tax=Paraconexibacter sp. TaxID=2949640 RepID=UPI003569C6AC